MRFRETLRRLQGKIDSWLRGTPSDEWHKGIRNWLCLELIEAHVEAGDVAGAKKTAAAALSGSSLLAEAYAGISALQAKAGDIPGAELTVSQIPRAQRSLPAVEGAYEELVVAHLKRGDVAAAKRSASPLRLHASRARAYARIAAVQIEQGDVAAGVSVGEVRRAAAGLKADSPDDCYTAAWSRAVVGDPRECGLGRYAEDARTARRRLPRGRHGAVGEGGPGRTPPERNDRGE